MHSERMEHVLRIFPNLADLARGLGVPYQTVAAWKQRGRLPAVYDLRVIKLAKARGEKLTLSQLAEARAEAPEGAR